MRRLITRSLLALLVAACASAPPPAEPLRVMVYNIHAGKDAGGADNLARVAELVTSSKADLVLLQEVDRNTERSGKVDQLAELERLTSFHGAFGRSLDYQGGEYGIAVLSRWPIAASEVIPLPNDPPQERAGGSREPRVALFVVTNGIRILNTHLDASRDETFRLQEVATLIAAGNEVEPTLVGGDFNAEPGSETRRRMAETGYRDAWEACGAGPELTFPASAPVKRIDYLFLTGEARCTQAQVLETTASDHRPLLVAIERALPALDERMDRGRGRGRHRM